MRATPRGEVVGMAAGEGEVDEPATRLRARLVVYRRADLARIEHASGELHRQRRIDLLPFDIRRLATSRDRGAGKRTCVVAVLIGR